MLQKELLSESASPQSYSQRPFGFYYSQKMSADLWIYCHSRRPEFHFPTCALLVCSQHGNNFCVATDVCRGARQPDSCNQEKNPSWRASSPLEAKARVRANLCSLKAHMYKLSTNKMRHWQLTVITSGFIVCFAVDLLNSSVEVMGFILHQTKYCSFTSEWNIWFGKWF